MTMMLVLLEGIALCFILVMICVVGIANGAVGSVYFYEKDVQQRVVELGLTTEETIRKRYTVAGIALFVPILVLVPMAVYFLNGARTFGELFWQILAVLMIAGVFDRLFIDWYWVNHTKAWVIPGTEGLQPYCPKKVQLRKWMGTLVGYPMIAAIVAGIVSLL